MRSSVRSGISRPSTAGIIDPLDLDEYLRHDGFMALRRCLREYDPGDDHGRTASAAGCAAAAGRASRPHVKWEKAREASGDVKYVICNGDEGDPGAFMDRMLLESFPYRVIEGMTIAALAIGAARAIFYIRAEYPLAVKRIREALRRCEDRGLVGERILGSDLQRPFPDHGRRRRVRLRRGDRADRLAGRPARHAPAAPARIRPNMASGVGPR